MKANQPRKPVFSSSVTESIYAQLDPGARVGAGQLVVMCAGRERCREDYLVERDNFPGYGVEFIAEGTGALRLGRKEHLIGPGHLFVYGPKTPHRIRAHGSSTMLKYFVDFFGKDAEAELRRVNLAPHGIRRVVEIEPMRRLLEEMLREGRKPDESRHAIVAAQLRLVLAKSMEATSALDGTALRARETFERCERDMENNLPRLKGLADFAREVGLAPAHLCRLYQRFAKTTPHALLTRRKMARAADLLMDRPTPMVKEVALAVGYEDALHFSRLFTRRFGSPPRQFSIKRGMP